ncbi:DUF3426 domain-containing protein [Alicycliphilus denitrificans]|uniref:MJ0042 family finger-like protein n=2 Tax=Alicycliphilus denitrificans TaxID=179636 RepID=F4GF54_ALIDK|nr:zinc-ribbon and DUF3426 domain-containing protein [Alicycliphilus denitrificans]ADV01381.1 MJ0042 family finger-like protein [Alicycliphilus denitrificans BC]AEB86158.1 MJ0042 family finger-like protein [Alicycliphilus denitrificans K601]QKD45445.1 DUF3426 domain-containing protein [Alicycliphilus denitrificans]GAO24932.1 mj0042 family finger-like protein [Alicycliphilus sp. B1]
MSQITRCPFCATTFKVVADQLRISDGWVRCGQCKEVFDASEHLLQPEPAQLLPEMPLDDPGLPDRHAADAPQPQDKPVTTSGGSEEVAPLSSLLRREAVAEEPEAMPEAAIQGYELPGATVDDSAWPQEPDAGVEAAEQGDDQQEAEPAPDTLDAEPPPDEEAQAAAPPESEPLEPLQPLEQESVLVEGTAIMPGAAHESDAPEETAASPVAEPGFVTAARRSAFWRRPAVRGALAVAVLALLLALGLQVVVQERDAIAARSPAAHALMERLCAPLQCTLQAPQRIASVVIDSSSFLKERNDAAAYQLQMSLKNISSLSVAMPALELTLTDVRDRAVLRRVLLRNDLGAPAELAPGSTWSATVSMQVAQGADQVAGYRLLAFYP